MVLCRSSSTLFRASRVSNFSLLQLLFSFFLLPILSFLLFLVVPVFRLKTKKKQSFHRVTGLILYLGVPAIQPTYPLEPAPPFLLPDQSPSHTLFFRRRRRLLLPAFFSGFNHIYFPPAVATVACRIVTPIALRRPHASAPPAPRSALPATSIV